VRGIAGFGSTPYDAVCAMRIAPMLGPPSEPLLARVTMPKGASGSEVPGVALKALRQPSTSAFWLHA
jgi:hypothetical protein